MWVVVVGSVSVLVVLVPSAVLVAVGVVVSLAARFLVLLVVVIVLLATLCSEVAGSDVLPVLSVPEVVIVLVVFMLFAVLFYVASWRWWHCKLCLPICLSYCRA